MDAAIEAQQLPIFQTTYVPKMLNQSVAKKIDEGGKKPIWREKGQIEIESLSK